MAQCVARGATLAEPRSYCRLQAIRIAAVAQLGGPNNTAPHGMAQPVADGGLGLTQTAFGLASGIFFGGYALMQVPSNHLLLRLGARRVLGCCTLLSGPRLGARAPSAARQASRVTERHPQLHARRQAPRKDAHAAEAHRAEEHHHRWTSPCMSPLCSVVSP